MAAYELRTFSDLVAAIREECGIQASDTTMVNRIKRDINTAYTKVVGKKEWWWLHGNASIQLPAYLAAGTASVSSGSSLVTLSVTPVTSKRGYYFALDGYNEIYKIESHSDNSATLLLDAEFTGTTNATASFRIWTDRLPLPTNCRETIKVWHDHSTLNLDPLGIQEFRRLASLAPRNEGKPRYYYTSDFVDPTETSAFASMPSPLTRTSVGVLKTIVFASGLPSAITDAVDAGDPVSIRASGAGHPSYNGDFLVGAISTTNVTNDTLTYTGNGAYAESGVTETAISILSLDNQETFDRYREMVVYPALNNSKTTIHVDYIKLATPLNNDDDEPVIPIEDREVLLYGGLERVWRKLRNPEESNANAALYREKLMEMQGELQDSMEKPRFEPSRLYLSSKRRLRKSRSLDPSGPISVGGGAGAAVVVGPANTVAVFGTDGQIGGSTSITTTELNTLDGITSSVQGQLDAITTLGSAKVYLGDASDVAQEVSLSGAITVNNTGVTTLQPSVVTNSNVDAAAAIAVSKLAALTASRALVSDGSGIISPSTVTATELSSLSGVEALTTVVLTNNTAVATAAVTWPVSGTTTVRMDYAITRGSSNIESGIIDLVTDGTNAAIAQGAVASLGSLGVTFSADVSGGNLRLKYQTTNTGTSASLTYKTSKWLA